MVAPQPPYCGWSRVKEPTSESETGLTPHLRFQHSQLGGGEAVFVIVLPVCRQAFLEIVTRHGGLAREEALHAGVEPRLALPSGIVAAIACAKKIGLGHAAQQERADVSLPAVSLEFLPRPEPGAQLLVRRRRFARSGAHQPD